MVEEEKRGRDGWLIHGSALIKRAKAGLLQRVTSVSCLDREADQRTEVKRPRLVTNSYPGSAAVARSLATPAPATLNEMNGTATDGILRGMWGRINHGFNASIRRGARPQATRGGRVSEFLQNQLFVHYSERHSPSRVPAAQNTITNAIHPFSTSPLLPRLFDP